MIFETWSRRPKADLAAEGPNLAFGPKMAEGPNLAEGPKIKYMYIYIYIYLPAYFYSLTSLVKTHFWMKNRDITCVWADTLSIRIFLMRRIRIWYPFFPYPRKITVFRWKCNFRSKNRELKIDVLSKNDRNYIFPRCRYHHSTRLDE